MNKAFVANIDKYYGYARKIAGTLGNDLLHSILERIPNDTKHLDSYVYTTLRNEFYNPSSPFNKAYRPQVFATFDEDQTPTHDVNLLYKILLDLEIEGYEREVKIFKECYFATNQSLFAKKTNINRKIINKICMFVKQEIQNRYAELDRIDV